MPSEKHDWYATDLWGTHMTVADVNASTFGVRVPNKQCPAPNHPDDPDVWCGCKHPDFWYWSDAGHKQGWMPVEQFRVATPEQRAKRSRDMKARWARLKALEAV